MLPLSAQLLHSFQKHEHSTASLAFALKHEKGVDCSVFHYNTHNTAILQAETFTTIEPFCVVEKNFSSNNFYALSFELYKSSRAPPILM